MEKVLLTGASSGIGKAIAQKLAQEGYRVIACVRKEEDAKAVEALSVNIESFILDVTDDCDIENLYRALNSSDTSLCAIINNAGIAVAGIMEYADIDAIKRQMEVNSFAPLKIASKFMPLMREGKIINISSVSSHLVYPFITPYCASKRLLDTFFQGMACELANNNIKIVSIKPGVIKTPIWDKSINAAKKHFSNIPKEGVEKYKNKVEKLLKGLKVSISQGLEPEVVAKTTLKALKAKNPKGSYNVGMSTYFGEFLSKLSVDIQRKLIRYHI